MKNCFLIRWTEDVKTRTENSRDSEDTDKLLSLAIPVGLCHPWVTQSTAQNALKEDSSLMDISAERRAVLDPGMKHIPPNENMENSCYMPSLEQPWFKGTSWAEQVPGMSVPWIDLQAKIF